MILNRKKRRDTNISEKELDLDITLKEFIDFLKQTPDYKQKGPFIYCVVQRDVNSFFSFILSASDLYHTGIFECTKKVLIHYGEEDINGNKKP